MTRDHIKKKSIIRKNILLSPLFWRFLSPIVLTLLCFTVAIYVLAVPYIRNLVYSLEEKSVKTNLHNIQKLIEANYLAIEAYKKFVTDSNKKKLRDITLFMEAYLKNKYEQVQTGLISEDEAQWNALEELRKFRYGKDDYVWVADYNGYYLSHPDPKINMEDYSQVRDVFGNYVLTPLIQMAIKNGEGYHSFWWQRLGNDLPAKKLTYARLFPQWEWVIGTGVYLDDLEEEVIMRKEKMIQELKQILKPITIGKTGYMYIFDSWKNIIIHPDETIENTNMASWINPLTHSNLADDLIAAAHSNKDGKVSYKWKRPGTPGDYLQDKIDWVTYVDGFDWYVVASVYTEDLNMSSILLRNRILLISGLSVIFASIVVSLLVGKLLNPIRRLSYTAEQVKAGDLMAQSDVKGKDEIGFLAETFNSMITQLRDIIQNLDKKVVARTIDLNRANEKLTANIEKLATHNRQVILQNNMAKKLQACQSLDDVSRVVRDSLNDLFPSASGIFYMFEQHGSKEKRLMPVISWGDHACSAPTIAEDECIALRDDRVLLPGISHKDATECKHYADFTCLRVCIPLGLNNEINALVSLEMPYPEHSMTEKQRTHLLYNWKQLVISIADQISMAIINIQLREQLREMSVRDGLTGLFNRRYMEETLEREFMQASRDGRPVGIIILDVDYFKNLNDTYGHKAGDLVLIRLAGLLSRNLRKGDIVCRYGGEEFLMIMPGASVSNAAQRAETIRAEVEGLSLDYNGHALQITVSLGTAAYPENGMSSEEVLKAADDALYLAKEQGRNKAVLA